MLNRQGDTVSAHLADLGAVTFENGQPFNLGRPFNLKNDGEAACFLEVNLWGDAPGAIRYHPLRHRMEPRDN